MYRLVSIFYLHCQKTGVFLAVLKATCFKQSSFLKATISDPYKGEEVEIDLYLANIFLLQPLSGFPIGVCLTQVLLYFHTLEWKCLQVGVYHLCNKKQNVSIVAYTNIKYPDLPAH